MTTTEEMLTAIFNGMTNFNTLMGNKINSLEQNVTQAMNAHYAVNHKPEMRFGIKDEFDFILDTLEPTTGKSMALVRGYAANGATIRVPTLSGAVYVYDSETGEYAELTGDYTVNCEDENGKEWISILYVQTDFDLANNDDGKLTVHYTECPLTETEILLHIGTATRLQPNVDELLTQYSARSLYVFSSDAQYGNYVWGLRISSPILSIYIQKNLSILTGCGFDTPSLVEMYLPNSTYVPKNSRGNRMALRKVDISNAQILNDNCLEYSQIGAETNGTQHINVQSIGGSAFYNCTALQNVAMSARMSSMTNNSFSGCYNIKTITVPVGYECLQNYFTAANSNTCGFVAENPATGKRYWECFKDVIDNCRDLTEISASTKGYWHLPSCVLTLINADTAFVAAANAKGWYFTT